MNPLVSVVITSFNRARFIGEAIESALSQTHSNIECIVVDDGSTDNTKEVVDSYIKSNKRVRFYSRPSDKPKGANACRNYGFLMSKGEYINWLDDDDLLHPQKIEKQLAMLEHSSDDFSVCQIQVFKNNKDQTIGLRSSYISSDDNLDSYLRQQFSWLTHAPLWKRTFLESMESCFDEDLQASQEWEFYMRALSKQPQIQFLKEPLVYSRVHESNVSANDKSEKKVWNYFLSRHKIYDGVGKHFSEQQQEYLRKFLLERFRESVVFRYDQNAMRIFRLFVRREGTISIQSKAAYWIAIFSFKWFGRGNILIQNIEYK